MVVFAAVGILTAVFDQATKAFALRMRVEIALAGIRLSPRLAPARRALRFQVLGLILLSSCVVVLATSVVLSYWSTAAGAAGIGAACGGASSNMIDRFARGGIVDFIVVGWWPVFNLADAAIVAGVAGALIGSR
jgi:lipoprotein signal peptidase